MKVLKKPISILLVIAFTCSILTGCDMGSEEIIEPTSELTIYLGPYDEVFFRKSIAKYRYKYSDVNLNVVDKSDLSWFEFNQKLKSEVQAGKGPDLIFNCANVFNDIYKGVDSGVFYDINKLIKTDETFKLSDYNKVALDAGVFNGKRFIMPISIRVPFLMTTQSIVDETGIDINKCDNIIGIGEQINKVLQDNPDKHIFAEKNTFYDFINFLGMDIVNYKNKKLTIDEQLTKKASELYKTLYLAEKNMPEPDNFSSNFDSYLNLIQKNEVFDYIYGGMIDEYFANAGALLAKDETPILLPIKTADNKIQSFVNKDVAISNTSENKLNAFNFIKVMLSNEVQSYERCPFDIPVNNESLDNRFDYLKINYQDEGSVDLDNEITIILPPTEDYFNKVNQNIKNVERCIYNDQALSFLIGHLYDYYEDKKSFDECLNDAKSQLEIYITE